MALLTLTGPAGPWQERDEDVTAFTFVMRWDGREFDSGYFLWSVVGFGPDAANAADFAGDTRHPGTGLPIGVIRLTSGQAQTLVIPVVGDRVIEADEGFTLRIIGKGHEASVAASIADDDSPLPRLSIRGVIDDRAEGTGPGLAVFSFLVTRSGDLSGLSTVFWRVDPRGETPADRRDFTDATWGFVSLAAGESEATVKVRVLRDAVAEGDEGFSVVLQNPDGATIAVGTAAATIRDDDAAFPALSVTPILDERAEGSGAGAAVFHYLVTREGDASAALDVPWQVHGAAWLPGMGSADGADFLDGVLPTGVVRFAPGEAAAAIKIRTLRDAMPEQDEGFVLQLGGDAAAARGVIRDDDTAGARFSISGVIDDRAEGTGAGIAAFTFLVTRDGDLSGSGSVGWSAAGTGANPADEADFLKGHTSGRVMFGPGETTKGVTVRVLRDDRPEADEGFTVTLEQPEGATLGVRRAEAVIRDDEIQPSHLTVVPEVDSRWEGTGAGVAVFSWRVLREGDLRGTAALDWEAVGLGADAEDFLGGRLPSGTLVFAPGVAEQTIKMRVLRDARDEGDEAFALALTGARGATFEEDLFLGRILDDEGIVTICACIVNVTVPLTPIADDHPLIA